MMNTSALKVVLLLGAAAWVIGMMVLTKASRPPQGATVVLSVYPGASQVERQSMPGRGLQVLRCRVPEGYPSQAVLRYYDEQLGPHWRKQGSQVPTWSVAGKPGRRDALLVAYWQDRQGLRQIELRMWWQEKRGAGSDLWVSLGRTPLPGSGATPEAPRANTPQMVK